MFLWEKNVQGRVPRLAGMIFIFVYMKSFATNCRMIMSRGIVLSLIQFDFSYSSAIIIFNCSGFILGLSASKYNPIKAI